MKASEEAEQEFKLEIERQYYGRVPKPRQVSQKKLDKRRKAAKIARKQRKRKP